MDILATPPGNSAPRLLHLSLDLIDIPEGGVRRQVVDGAQEAGLLNSVSQLGIIQPIAVRAHPHDPAAAVPVAAEPPKPAAEFDCPRFSGAMCPEHGTTVCLQQCPHHGQYTAWLATPDGKRAQRRAESDTSGLHPKKRRGRHAGAEAARA
jgi:hypothetical protein